MAEYRLVLVGFGNVGQAFVRLLLNKREELARTYNFEFRVTGIATGRHGMAIDPEGIDLQRALDLASAGESLESLSATPAPDDIFDFIATCPADILFENSPVNHHNGQPSIDHIRVGLMAGMHAITANKGAVVYGYRLLTELAQAQDRRFMYESTVMDGAPIFSLFRGPLPATELRGFHGILNSTTNMVIELMESGNSFEEAIAQAQNVGIAETDPTADVEGWDAAIKVAALATVVMGESLTPDQVDRQGIRNLTPEMLLQAREAGERWKLVCRCRRNGHGLKASVAPERVSCNSPLYSIRGTSSYVEFELDALPGLGIVESDPGPETTAYGLLADCLNVLRGM